jgi:hypothetical protein
MNRFVIAGCCAVLLGSTHAYAQNFEIKNSGKTYPWFYEKDSRVQRIDKHLPYLSKDQRSKLFSDKGGYFSPVNGDIGKLVLDLSPNEEKAVINVAGHYVLVDKAAIEEVSSKSRAAPRNRHVEDVEALMRQQSKPK